MSARLTHSIYLETYPLICRAYRCRDRSPVGDTRLLKGRKVDALWILGKEGSLDSDAAYISQRVAAANLIYC
jgi:hypothetical protein